MSNCHQFKLAADGWTGKKPCLPFDFTDAVTVATTSRKDWSILHSESAAWHGLKSGGLHMTRWTYTAVFIPIFYQP